MGVSKAASVAFLLFGVFGLGGMDMHITMTGNLGSGKSTISKLIAEEYGMEIYSTGKIQRELAAERGLTVLEMNKLMQQDHSFDNIIDDRVRQVSIDRKDDLFFDSRLAWHFAVDTFKVFLSVNINEAARRVYGDNRGDVESYASVEDCKKQLQERAHTEDIRYEEIYGIHYFDLGNYNLILDSTFSDPATLVEVLMNEKAAYEAKVAAGEKNIPTRILLSPGRLLGTNVENTRDNDMILDSDTVIRTGADDFEIVSGRDAVEKAAREGYEFISVKNQ